MGNFDHIEETTADGMHIWQRLIQLNLFWVYKDDYTVHAGIKVRVYCPVGKSDDRKFALNVSVKKLDIFTR